MAVHTQPYPARSYPASQGDAADTLFRSAVFVFILAGAWTSFSPFQRLDLAFEVTDVGNSSNQALYSTLFIVLAIWSARHQPVRLVLLIRPVMILALAWCALSIVSSWEPSLSARRFAFALVTVGIAAMTLLLPRNLRHFADLMAAVALIILVTSYIGIVIVPSRTIHQASDVIEPELAGNWRGVFPHKNGAGAGMVVFVFSGILTRQVRSHLVGNIIIVLAVPFLWFTHSKTAIAELPMVLIVGYLMARMREPIAGLGIVLTVIAVIESLSIGSMYSKSIHDGLESVGMDPTFTGRIDVWKFVISHIAENPITGTGFSTFWGTSQVVYGMNENGWASTASTAHNGYLDLALTIGIPGSFLMTMWLLFVPLIDFYRAGNDPANQPLRMFFLHVCLFAAFESCFESSFVQVGTLLIILLLAVFGLRYLSATRVVP